MDTKQIIQWTLKHWWWFAISVAVCVLVAGALFATTSLKYEVRATLMLRQVAEKETPDEMMQIMGMRGAKNAADEVKVLTSRNLVGRVVDELDLCTIYSKKDGRRWREQYPNHDLTVMCQGDVPLYFCADVVVRGNKYHIKVNRYHKLAERFTVTDLSKPIHTKVGDMYFQLCDTITKGHYRAVYFPRASMVDMLAQQLDVARSGRESDIITIKTVTDEPYRMRAMIAKLLQFYNEEATMDKNILAIQAEQFLADRITVVEQELTNLELAIEAYKRAQQIANLSRTADNYQQLGVTYEQQVAQLDADIRMLDYMLKQLDDPQNAYTTISGNLLEKNELLEDLVKDYNSHVIHRIELLQTATEQNIVVVKENKLIAKKRESVKDGILQNRQKLMMKRQFVLDQQQQYNGRLASIPETERHYVELCREKETKENQYVYLIKQREENTLMLSAAAVPARVVEDAQISPSSMAPDLKKMLMIALLLGLLYPYIVYVFEIFRKEFL